MTENVENLLKLIKENPELPVVPMVDCDVVGEDCGRWMGAIGKAYVSEYALYNDRYYDDRDDFKEAYYDKNDEELDKKFGYTPAITDYTLASGNCTEEGLKKNNEAEAKMEEYLDEIAEGYFTKAILVNIDLPD